MAKSIGGTRFAKCIDAVCISESPLWEVPLYHISMKSCQGYLFQGPIECSDNPRVDRFARAMSMVMEMYKHAHMQLLIMSPLYACIMCVRVHLLLWIFTMWQDFNGSIYWDELAEICGDILSGVGF